LAVFPDGPPRDARNYRVDETLLPTPAFQRFGSLEAWKQRRAKILELLRGCVFRNLPASAPPLNPRREDPEARFQKVSFTSEPGIEIQGVMTRPQTREGRLPALLYVASNNDDPDYLGRLFRHPERSAPIVQFGVFPRGTAAPALPRSLWLDLFRNAMHTGNTLDSLRVWDVLRAFELLRSQAAVDPARITLAGRGQAGILALYAAILNERVHQVLLIDPPSSHVHGPYFLNVLRYTDIPEAAALLAPRRLNFYRRLPPAFERTREIYKLYGKPDHVFLTMEILNVVVGRYDHNFASGW
ncbi:MAG: acetylxylan esterase, partial [Armatimonadetes bacterium]|nr:acetylxylan esterase [Armatimonadota bacterium]